MSAFRAFHVSILYTNSLQIILLGDADTIIQDLVSGLRWSLHSEDRPVKQMGRVHAASKKEPQRVGDRSGPSSFAHALC